MSTFIEAPPGAETVRLTKGAERLVRERCEELSSTAPVVAKTTAQMVKETLEMSTCILDQLRDIQEAIDTFRPLSKDYMTEMRSFRMAAVGEVTSLRKELEEVRRFFLSDQHKVEVERLREFIGLCERLKALKESGFLDAVADTMLKLA